MNFYHYAIRWKILLKTIILTKAVENVREEEKQETIIHNPPEEARQTKKTIIEEMRGEKHGKRHEKSNRDKGVVKS